MIARASTRMVPAVLPMIIVLPRVGRVPSASSFHKGEREVLRNLGNGMGSNARLGRIRNVLFYAWKH